MWPILVGIETEYGFSVEGHGADQQIDDAMALVRGTPDGRFVGWDYRFEASRTDLRGFQVSNLTFDPEDAKFDEGKVRPADREIRSDRVLANGARFYNDHGHPEYSTPECHSVDELALHDNVGERVTLRAARAFAEASGKDVHVYKNNTDGHGASYGTHENFLVPRSVGFDSLYDCVLPMLIARQVVCGAGKVGSESGQKCDYQISQRADFLTEPISVDTLYRRPVFNTRDEPHADPGKWIRLHVICGDSNRILAATARKIALIKLALWLQEVGQCPVWRLSNPPISFNSVSRDLTCGGRIDLEGGSWTQPLQILESYLDAGERYLERGNPLVCEVLSYARESTELIEDWIKGGDRLSFKADWAAKLKMLQSFIDSEDVDWSDPILNSYDLAYHDVEPETSLFSGMQDSHWLEPEPALHELEMRMRRVCEPTRAIARSAAVTQLSNHLVGVSWGSLTFEVDGERTTVALKPEVQYPDDLSAVQSVKEFVEIVETLT